MTKAELIQNISEKSDISRTEVNKVVNVLFDELAECMIRKDAIQIYGFGTFTTTHRKERIGKNPQSGERMLISECDTPAFKASTALKRRINQR